MMRPGCFHTATLREAWGNRSWASPQQVWQADGIMWLAELLCLPSPQDSGATEICQIALDTDGGHFSSRRASLHGNLDWKWELSARLISLSFFFKTFSLTSAAWNICWFKRSASWEWRLRICKNNFTSRGPSDQSGAESHSKIRRFLDLLRREWSQRHHLVDLL